MSLLILVRHGQATLDGDDYDQLSPLGVEQSRALGEHWATFGTTPNRVLVGPRRRHRQTHDAVAEVFHERGLPWPEPVDFGPLDEHHGPAVLQRHASRLEAEADDSPAATDENPMRAYMRLFQRGSRAWVRGELETPDDLEDWPSFRRRIDGGLDTVRRDPDLGARGATIAAFTSGGAISAAVGHVLGLDDEAVIELSWVVRNATVTTLRFTPDRGYGLVDFNSLPFSERRLMTFV